MHFRNDSFSPSAICDLVVKLLGYLDDRVGGIAEVLFNGPQDLIEILVTEDVPAYEESVRFEFRFDTMQQFASSLDYEQPLLSSFL